MCTAASALLAQRKVKALPAWAPQRLLQAVAGALGRLQRNGHSVVGPQGQEHGKGVFLLGSLVDHSCGPSAMAVYTTQGSSASEDAVVCRQHLVSTRALAAGESVTIGYVDPLLGAVRNRQTLSAEYGFDCACSECCADAQALAGSGEAQLGSRPCRVWRERCVPCVAQGCSGMMVPCGSSSGWASLEALDAGGRSPVCDMVWRCHVCSETAAPSADTATGEAAHAPLSYQCPGHPVSLAAARAAIAENHSEHHSSGQGQSDLCKAALYTLGVLGVCPSGSPVPAQQLLACGELALGSSSCSSHGRTLLRCAVGGSGGGGGGSRPEAQAAALFMEAVHALLEILRQQQLGAEQLRRACVYASWAVLYDGASILPLGLCGLPEHKQLQATVQSWLRE